MTKTIQAKSGHTFCIIKAEPTLSHPAGATEYTSFYEVRMHDATGPVYFYIAKGYNVYPGGANQLHVWYRNRKMWSSFGLNFQAAIDGAIQDGWLYTE